MVILAGIYGLMGLGYQLVFGQLGALNLAQGALFGLGAYAAALTAPVARAVRAARGDPRGGDPGGAGGGAAAAPAVALLRARHPGARLAGQPFGGACREFDGRRQRACRIRDSVAARARPAGDGLGLPDRGRAALRLAVRRPARREGAPAARGAVGCRDARHRWCDLAVRGVRRGRRAGRTGRRLLGRLERRRLAGSDRLFDHGAVPDPGGAGRLAPSDGRGRRRRARRRPARAAARPAGRMAAGLRRRHAGRRAVGAGRAWPG